jgi:alpha-L-fucosidase
VQRHVASRIAARALLIVALGTAAWIANNARAPVASVSAGPVPATGARYVAGAENRSAREWFQDAKFGVFIHWGLYSELGGAGEPGLSEWIMERKRIPAQQYARLAELFHPTAFDAEQWVRQIEASGARYITFTSKHHDGFAMFASKASSYNVVNGTPFKRDPVAELAQACHRHGIKLFLYYSQLDWHHPDYFPRGRTGGGWTGAMASGDWNRYIDYQNAQLRELLTNYGPIGGIWLDGWWDQAQTSSRDGWRLSETYALIHSLQPATLITNNHHVAPFPGEDYQTFEQHLPDGEQSSIAGRRAAAAREAPSLPLETSETMNGSWGFNLIDDQFKPTRTLVRTLVGAAGRNGNLLLNTGPMPDGRLQPENVQTLSEIGRWLALYGEAIYDTRGGPIAPRPWGVTTQAKGKVYVHVLDWQDERLLIPLSATVRRASWVKDGSQVRFRRTAAGLELQLPPADAADWDRVIRLEL